MAQRTGTWGRRALAACLAVAAAVAGVTGCSGSEEASPTTTAASSTTGPPLLDEADRACGAAAALMYRQAAKGALDVEAIDQPAVAGLVPEQIRAFLRDLADLAGEADPGDRAALDDIATVTEATDAFASAGTPYSATAQVAFDRILRWSASGPCPPSTIVWACIHPTTEVLAADAPVGPTPDEAVAAEDGDGERIVLDRSDVAVAYGWVDRHDLVSRRATVSSEAGTWRLQRVTACPDHGEPGG